MTNEPPSQSRLDLFLTIIKEDHIQGCWKTQKDFNDFWTLISALFAFVSIYCGVVHNYNIGHLDGAQCVCPNGNAVHHNSVVGLIFVGIWLVGPPIYLWIDWVAYDNEVRDPSKHVEMQAYLKHTHDLTRNLWIALVLILIYLFDLRGLIPRLPV